MFSNPCVHVFVLMSVAMIKCSSGNKVLFELNVNLQSMLLNLVNYLLAF